MTLSKRLLSAVKYVRNFKCLADCGTDHGLFPIFAVENGYVEKAIASDNKERPLRNAIKNITEHDLEDKIKTILADGLPYLDNEVDVVSILGMGGILMSEILTKANLKSVRRLVLSPNSEAYSVRNWLQDNSFWIVAEEMIKDRGKHYQIIVAEKGHMELTDLEKEFGPLLIKNKDKVLFEKLRKLILELEHATKLAKSEEGKNEIDLRIKVLKEVLR